MTKRIVRSALSLSILSVLASVTFAADQKTSAVAEPVKLETIVVTASGQAVDVKSAPASISVVTSEDIQRQPFNSLSEVLSDLPGVTGGYSNAGAGSNITLRGMPDKYTLILVDGKRIGNQSL